MLKITDHVVHLEGSKLFFKRGDTVVLSLHFQYDADVLAFYGVSNPRDYFTQEVLPSLASELSFSDEESVVLLEWLDGLHFFSVGGGL